MEHVVARLGGLALHVTNNARALACAMPMANAPMVPLAQDCVIAMPDTLEKAAVEFASVSKDCVMKGVQAVAHVNALHPWTLDSGAEQSAMNASRGTMAQLVPSAEPA